MTHPGCAGTVLVTRTAGCGGKRGDTDVGTIEDKYGRDFGVRSDMHLDTLLRREGAQSLSDLLKRR